MEAVCSKFTINANNSFLLITTYISQEKRDQLDGLLKILDRCKHYKYLILIKYLKKYATKSPFLLDHQK